MSMDLGGIKPTAEVGREYWCSNLLWHPLWSYFEEVAPDAVRVLVSHWPGDKGRVLSADAGHYNSRAALHSEGRPPPRRARSRRDR
jgi:hypothetical protein